MKMTLNQLLVEMYVTRSDFCSVNRKIEKGSPVNNIPVCGISGMGLKRTMGLLLLLQPIFPTR